MDSQETGERDVEVVVKKSLQRTLEKISEEQNIKLDKDASSGLLQLLLLYGGQVAKDAAMFAKHGKRRTVQQDDIRLCARRSRVVVEKLDKFAEELEEKKRARKKKRKASSDEPQDQEKE